MPCCLLLIALLIGPRVAIVLLALFTSFFERAFDGLLIPFLGFLFLPFTTLAYTWAYNSGGVISGGEVLLLIIAILADLGVFGRGEMERRKRIA
jgi:hypothetical protein